MLFRKWKSFKVQDDQAIAEVDELLFKKDRNPAEESKLDRENGVVPPSPLVSDRDYNRIMALSKTILLHNCIETNDSQSHYIDNKKI